MAKAKGARFNSLAATKTLSYITFALGIVNTNYTRQFVTEYTNVSSYPVHITLPFFYLVEAKEPSK